MPRERKNKRKAKNQSFNGKKEEIAKNEKKK